MQKEDLSIEDSCLLQEKQKILFQKIEDYEGIMRKLSNTIGLRNPSSDTFAKYFDLLPPSHKVIKKINK